MTASFADQEIWHVLVASDDMKRMNVDQLDDAFRLDIVDASTLVWKAGMRTWQRLGSLAGIEDDEPETIIKQVMPVRSPPPPPRPRPLAPQPPRPAPVPAFQTQQFAAPLVATPMYVPQLYAPDPYALPQRRAKVPSEVDFRRRSGGVRLGRWLVGLLIVTTGFLVCYRQNLLREGARRVGIENKYLYGEKRALAFVTAKAPRSVQNVLTRLALLPGPNAAPLVMKAPDVKAPEPVAAAVAPAGDAVKAPASTDSNVKTVSLDSLPVLGNEAASDTAPAKSVASPAPVAKASAPRAAAVARKPVAKAPRAAAAAARDEEDEAPAPKAKAKKAEPKPEPEPKAVAKQAPPPPPSGNESFLKAAIRSAIAADASKGK